jgi:hypothetical protein
MLQLHNSSPLVPAIFGFPDARGVDTLIVAVKASFELSDSPRLAAEQRPVALTDEHYGDAATSSLRVPSEAHLAKPGTDVILIGHARAPRGQPVSELDVGVQVGERIAVARVYGDRVWTQGRRGLVPGAAQPFVNMPVIYERAFGGPGTANPVGVGALAGRSELELLGHAAPNLDDPRAPLGSLGQSPTPVGFGAIAPSWPTRAAHAGTYDQRWQTARAPYLPLDFDARYFHVAPPGLIFESPLRGGEPIVLYGFHPERRLQFSLPRCRLDVRARVAGSEQRLQPALDLVLLEPDELRFTMTWRASLAVGEQMLRVERVDVGLAELEDGQR